VSASIVIPTTMRRDTVAGVVEAALAAVSQMPGGEIILVPNGPADRRRPLEFRSPRLRVVECPVPRASAARNAGMREARNEVVLFTDDDCLISAEWVARLTRRLGNGAIAVATPVEIRREGPVTTFLDYQRIFHPRPIDASTVVYGHGASVGVRRDLAGVAFDDDMEAGDDVQFGTRLREAGVSTAYDAHAPPPVHLVAEGVETLAARFFRYGTSLANVFLHKDRPQFSIPHATTLYSSLCRNEIATPRRFEELADPSLREAFATFERILLGAFLVAYLAEAGRALGREIIRVDQEGLAAGWLQIESRLESAFGWDGDWRQLPLDFGRWLRSRETRAPVLAPDVADNLRRNAPLTRRAGPDPDLDRGADQIARQAEEIWVTVNEIWHDLREGRLDARVDPIDCRLRGAGVSFREGLQTMETIALGPVRLAGATAMG
jgi:glycosyltransferase involved in cell wall biosynthesis